MTAILTLVWCPLGSAGHRSPRPPARPRRRGKPALVAVLEDAARADGARAEDVAGPQLGVARGVRHDRLPRVVHGAEVAAGTLFPVHARDHLEPEVAQLVRGDDDRADRGGEVLSLRGAEADSHLAALQVACRPVVQDREAADPSLGADHGRDLELVVERLGAVRVRNLVPGPVDRRGVREVERRDLVPLVGTPGRPVTRAALRTCSSKA